MPNPLPEHPKGNLTPPSRSGSPNSAATADRGRDVVLVIEAGRAELHYWRDLWRYRELFFFLAWRDILVRYKQTAIGVAWAVIRPLVTLVVLSLVFGKVARLPSAGGAPYPLLVFAAMLPWQLFSGSFSEAGTSIVGNANLISKVYFPRLAIPASTLAVNFVDFLFSALVLVGIMVWYQYFPDWRVFFLPVFILLAMATAFGAGLWIASLTVRYRDFRFVVPFIVQFGLYVSPVGFDSSVVPDRFRTLYGLNPLVGVIDGFRWCLLRGGVPLRWEAFQTSLWVTLGLLVSGIWYFRRTERSFADTI